MRAIVWRRTMAKLAVLLLVILSCKLLAAEEDVLELSSSLTPSSRPLNSSNSAFMLSLRSSSSSSSSSMNLYLAISFTVSPDGPPAWVASRDTAVSASANLTLSSSGDLRLYDPSVSSSTIWSSGTSGLGVVRAKLLDTGNLVLLNSSSGYVWQSFRQPTDTLLPGQPFTATSQLISGKRSEDFSTGRYNLTFSVTGVLQLSYTQYTANSPFTEVYWPDLATISGQGTFVQFDQLGNISVYNSPASINLTFISNDYGTSAKRRLTLDVDGNLRMYSWDQAAAQWRSVWLAFTDVCSRVRQLCGNYGVCINDPQPTCMCPSAFSAVDPTDLSGGCRPNYQLNNCSSTKYVEMEDTDFPWNDYHDFITSSEEDCKHQCFVDGCSCVAAIYWQSGDGHCWLKQKMQNGYSPASQKHRVFIKISDSDPFVPSPILDRATNWSSQSLWQPPAASSNQSTTGFKEAVVIALAVVIAVQALCFVAAVAVLVGRFRRNLRYIRLHGDLEGVSGSPLVRSYQELEAATENFSKKLGAGSFGTVYKGKFPNGKVVAVKQLEGVSQQEKQFRAEIVTIGRIHHINLLPLLGFCAEGSHRLLVYEYMENGSVDQILFDKCGNSGPIKALDWGTRFQICLGVARGITYLHQECLDCILHCDIKPENILLDKNNCPKVADFGLAYLFTRDHTVKMTTIRGTRGYMAPEWVSNLPITAKADVYSYGMLVMEIVSGRRNYLYTESAMMETNDKWCFPMWAYGKRAEEVVDARMEEVSVDWKQADAVLKVVFACIQSDMQARPPMGKVVQMLEGTLPIPEVPPPSLFPADHHGRYLVSSSSNVPITSSSTAPSLSSSFSITNNIARAR